jgi:uncharacterized membrane protein
MILGYLSIGLTIFIVLVLPLPRTVKPWMYYSGLFVVGCSLLLSTTNAGHYLIGTDINVEYYYARQALLNGWDISLPSSINSSMSVTVLSPLLAGYHESALIWVFKIGYPILFAMVPVLLCYIYSRFMPVKWAFLSAFVFILVPTFFLEMPQVTRQMIAMLIIAGMLAILSSKAQHKYKMLCLFIGTPLVIVSHYSTALFWMAILLVTVVGYYRDNQKWKTLDVSMILLINSILLIVYARWVSSGWQVEDAGNALSRLGKLNPIEYIITIPTLAILSYGLYCLLKWNKVSTLYKSWAVVVGLILAVGCLYPPLADTINFTRYLQLCLMILAPCAILVLKRRQTIQTMFSMLVCFFIILSGLLFNLLKIDNIAHFNIPYSIALENKRLDAGNYIISDDNKVARWAYDNGYREVYGDLGGTAILQNYFSVYQAKPINVLVPGNVVLFRTWNTQHNTIAINNGIGLRRQDPIPPDLRYKIIYQSGECKLVEIQ